MGVATVAVVVSAAVCVVVAVVEDMEADSCAVVLEPLKFKNKEIKSRRGNFK